MFKPFDLVYTRNASEEWVQSRKFPFPGHTCSQSLCFQSCYVECSYICNLRHFLRKVSSENSRLGSTWEKSNACSWLNVFESKIFQQIFRVLPVLLLKKKMSRKAQTKVSCFDSEWFIYLSWALWCVFFPLAHFAQLRSPGQKFRQASIHLPSKAAAGRASSGRPGLGQQFDCDSRWPVDTKSGFAWNLQMVLLLADASLWTSLSPRLNQLSSVPSSTSNVWMERLKLTIVDWNRNAPCMKLQLKSISKIKALGPWSFMGLCWFNELFMLCLGFNSGIRTATWTAESTGIVAPHQSSDLYLGAIIPTARVELWWRTWEQLNLKPNNLTPTPWYYRVWVFRGVTPALVHQYRCVGKALNQKPMSSSLWFKT